MNIFIQERQLSEGRTLKDVAYEKYFMHNSSADIWQKLHSGWEHLMSQLFSQSLVLEFLH